MSTIATKGGRVAPSRFANSTVLKLLPAPRLRRLVRRRFRRSRTRASGCGSPRPNDRADKYQPNHNEPERVEHHDAARVDQEQEIHGQPRCEQKDRCESAAPAPIVGPGTKDHERDDGFDQDEANVQREIAGAIVPVGHVAGKSRWPRIAHRVAPHEEESTRQQCGREREAPVDPSHVSLLSRAPKPGITTKVGLVLLCGDNRQSCNDCPIAQCCWCAASPKCVAPRRTSRE